MELAWMIIWLSGILLLIGKGGLWSTEQETPSQPLTTTSDKQLPKHIFSALKSRL